MSNSTATTDAPFYDLGLGVPLWVVIVWSAVGVLIVTMVIVVLCVCHTRKKVPDPDTDSPIEEERRTYVAAMFDTYPQNYIEELHNKQHNVVTRQLFSRSFVQSMKMPRAVEVNMTDTESTPKTSGPSQFYQTNAADNRGVSFDEFTIHEASHEFGSLDDEDFYDLHASKSRINLSREASFKASSISEENKARQLYREKMLVNELREKIRREKVIVEESCS